MTDSATDHRRVPAADGRIGPGRLVLVVGPSGAGKDTLMTALRAHLAGDPRYMFARRLITRTPDAAAEDHDTLSSEDFERLVAAGDVGLAWRAHGLGYVLPRTIDATILAGGTVIANGSRGVLSQAFTKYADVRVLLVTAPRSVLAERLAARGRESREEIERRLDRADLDLPDVPHVARVDNTGTIADGVARMIAALD
ncbi:phosphonate metabolism protein/1,5-bisphosphokinase (PRPP-forming) PhnN [Polymorphum gilvum]|uniref:Ribose 1,5-bisphosphate phosphokinase PhnN n=1 Tax=Polymorphum gilvum (strain LMG 25793 / CGMCC 1.9160 / SL003B-26A1) TaxID=991905 RepID=F2J2Y5_POLGS|nr:phosphonate metabolism protein/1,5-bisphosphokinase (PRPP-forming) PhnN [Polymorphum gilvum]ADZ68855.1 Phosphonate metabolism protein/1,5-bisphosphokinase (PRPP-forming) PhnN [Polymorphum gilvum SL003B-26A1]